MKAATLFFVSVLIPYLLCAQTAYYNSRFIGKEQSKIIKHEGQPEKVFDDGHGGSVLVYSYLYTPSRSKYSNSSSNNRGLGAFLFSAANAINKPPQSHWTYTLYFINDKFLVYQVKTKQLQLPPQQVNSLSDIYSNVFDVYNDGIPWQRIEVFVFDSLDDPISLMPLSETHINILYKPKTINQIDSEKLNYIKKLAAQEGGTRVYIDIKHVWDIPPKPNYYYMLIAR
ncbi:MAG TPA: hypothetical protein VKG26_16765 [Bacteroidia bacterium]|nr:hypothetical protein [Bacteroidia bacterium]